MSYQGREGLTQIANAISKNNNAFIKLIKEILERGIEVKPKSSLGIQLGFTVKFKDK